VNVGRGDVMPARWAGLAGHVEGEPPAGTPAVHREIVVEGCRPLQPQAPHHGEAGPIRLGEILPSMFLYMLSFTNPANI